MESFRKNLKWYLPAVLSILSILIWSAVLAEAGPQSLKIAFLDVGQGDAIYIESPSGRQILVDGGPPGKILPALTEVMPFYDRSIDILIVTNPDQDHIAGLVDVLNNYEVSLVLEPGTFNPSKIYAALEKTAVEKGVPAYLARQGMLIDLGAGAHLRILFPDQDVSNWKTNDGSIVAKLEYGETAVMLQGDAPQKTEKYLVGKCESEDPCEELRADILKVGHHGSKTSTAVEYIEVVSPYYAVITSGRNNKYGHPHPEVLEALEEQGVEILRTDELGTIIFESDGKNFKLKR